MVSKLIGKWHNKYDYDTFVVSRQNFIDFYVVGVENGKVCCSLLSLWQVWQCKTDSNFSWLGVSSNQTRFTNIQTPDYFFVCKPQIKIFFKLSDACHQRCLRQTLKVVGFVHRPKKIFSSTQKKVFPKCLLDLNLKTWKHKLKVTENFFYMTEDQKFFLTNLTCLSMTPLMTNRKVFVVWWSRRDIAIATVCLNKQKRIIFYFLKFCSRSNMNTNKLFLSKQKNVCLHHYTYVISRLLFTNCLSLSIFVPTILFLLWLSPSASHHPKSPFPFHIFDFVWVLENLQPSFSSCNNEYLQRGVCQFRLMLPEKVLTLLKL